MITSRRNSFFSILPFILLLFTGTAGATNTEHVDDHENHGWHLKVHQVFVNYDNHTMQILGEDFRGQFAYVKLAEQRLTVTGFNESEINAQLPKDISPGTYRLLVRSGFGENKQDTFDVTIGAVGPQGPQGEQGLQGEKGDKGDIGDQGPQGPMGLTGPEGQQGPIGLTGPAGPQGVAGPVGATGPQGPAGPRGPQGPPGPAGGSTVPQVAPVIGYLMSQEFNNIIYFREMAFTVTTARSEIGQFGHTGARADFSDLSLTLVPGQDMTNLMRYVADGRHLDEIDVYLYTDVHHTGEVELFKLHEIVVTSFFHAAEAGGTIPVIKTSLNFAEYEFTVGQHFSSFNIPLNASNGGCEADTEWRLVQPMGAGGNTYTDFTGIDSMSMGMANSGSTHTGGGGGSGRAVFNDVTLASPLMEDGPCLLNNLVIARRLNEVDIYMFDSLNTPFPYVEYTLEDSMISGYSIYTDGQGEVQQNVTLNYSRIRTRAFDPNDQNSGSIDFGWDIGSNTSARDYARPLRVPKQ